ncbi:hypothetical protein H8S90_05680 [Olivibacter sp. SDN3]|uniref:hypothetical protein n=1 Tax=Olivibacter sp. SDN3 TaxID=2764720 RepID=UPI0016511EB0|nr:hypothetical protein [Olivibacter sp. SDN3]QNL51076.1 hypothetical protein H8S90_05680 [Olivibacter sp. SDN3]
MRPEHNELKQQLVDTKQKNKYKNTIGLVLSKGFFSLEQAMYHFDAIGEKVIAEQIKEAIAFENSKKLV